MICKTCGEGMIGDGFTRVVHCPNVDCDDVEPDANPIHCEPIEGSLQLKVYQLTEALERAELRLEQEQNMNKLYKKRVDDLEAVVTRIINALRGE